MLGCCHCANVYRLYKMNETNVCSSFKVTVQSISTSVAFIEQWAPALPVNCEWLFVCLSSSIVAQSGTAPFPPSYHPSASYSPAGRGEKPLAPAERTDSEGTVIGFGGCGCRWPMRWTHPCHPLPLIATAFYWFPLCPHMTLAHI